MGAYDAHRFRQMVQKKRGVCIVPPPKDAIYKGQKDSGWEYERDGAIAAIQGFGGDEVGRRLWKICSGYYKRSRVETAMFRIKKLLGGGLKSRIIGTQKTEGYCKSIVINRMNTRGMPKFDWVYGTA